MKQYILQSKSLRVYQTKHKYFDWKSFYEEDADIILEKFDWNVKNAIDNDTRKLFRVLDKRGKVIKEMEDKY